MTSVRIARNTATAATIELHLRDCSGRFMPPLDSRVDLAAYSSKLAHLSDRFEAWYENRLVGLVAAYLNRPATKVGFLTSVSVVSEFLGRGLASRLIADCRREASIRGFSLLQLEVHSGDAAVVALYERCGFATGSCVDGQFIIMTMQIGDT